MPAVKVSIQLSSLRLPFRKAIVTAARLGATGLEIDARGEFRPQDLTRTAAREIKYLLDESSLRVAAVAFRTRRGYDEPSDLDRRLAATKEAMKFAAALGAPIVVNRVGHIPAEAGTTPWNQLLEALLDLGTFGQHAGARLAAETGDQSAADMARLLAALPPESIGIDLDPGRLVMHGHSSLEAVDLLGSSIVHVHARDGVRDLYRGQGVEVPLGRGSVDIPALLGALEERVYRGYFTIARDHCDDPEHEIGAAVKYLRSL